MPEPDSPTMPRLRPGSIVKLTPSSARTTRGGREQALARQAVVADEVRDLEQRRGHRASVASRARRGGCSARGGRRRPRSGGGTVRQALGDRERAAAGERAARRQVGELGHGAGDRRQPLRRARAPRRGPGGEQALRVGVRAVGGTRSPSGRSRRRCRRTSRACGRHVSRDHAEIVARSAAAPCRVSATSSAIRSRICACTVTSSAVVGSSAISRSGPQASAMAITTRWRWPPESWCG